MTILRAEPRIVAIESVAVTSDELITDFADGRRISLPLAWYPRLLHATPTERDNWRLVGNGEAFTGPTSTRT
jgi:hypothetical protein